MSFHSSVTTRGSLNVRFVYSCMLIGILKIPEIWPMISPLLDLEMFTDMPPSITCDCIQLYAIGSNPDDCGVMSNVAVGIWFCSFMFRLTGMSPFKANDKVSCDCLALTVL